MASEHPLNHSSAAMAVKSFANLSFREIVNLGLWPGAGSSRPRGSVGIAGLLCRSQGEIACMEDCQCLCHSYQTRHVHWGYYQHLDTNEPKDNWQNKQHQDNAFQAFRETNQNLLDLV